MSLYHTVVKAHFQQELSPLKQNKKDIFWNGYCTCHICYTHLSLTLSASSLPNKDWISV